MLVLKFSENLRVLESVPEKSFHRNDAGFLKLTLSYSVGSFKGYCYGL